MTSLELLQEIDAWLSFNNSPSKEQISELRNDIKKHISEQLNIHDVVCSCYMCGKTIEQPEEQFDMFGEIVCESCWDYNMYQSLQDGGGM